MFGLEGHTVTPFGDSILVIGGKTDAFDLNDTVLALQFTSCEWRRQLCEGDPPVARAYHSACLHASRVLIFGGLTSIGVHDMHYNTYNVFTAGDGLDPDVLSQVGSSRLRHPSWLPPLVPRPLEVAGVVYALDLAADPPRWQTLFPAAPHPDVPSHRTHHTAAVYRDVMFVLGGYNVHAPQTRPEREIGRMYQFDLCAMQWRSVRWSAPLAYWGATLTTLGGSMFCHFGGVSRDLNKETRDTFLLDVASGDVLPIAESARTPMPRAAHCAWRWGGCVYIFGGAGSMATRFYGDICRFDPPRRAWEVISTGGDVPPPRSGCTAVVVGEHVVLIGGLPSNLVRSSEVYCLNLHSLTWKRVEVAAVDVLGTVKLPNAAVVRPSVTRGTQTEAIQIYNALKLSVVQRQKDELDELTNADFSRRSLVEKAHQIPHDEVEDKRPSTLEMFDRWDKELHHLRGLEKQWSRILDSHHADVDMLGEQPKRQIT